MALVENDYESSKGVNVSISFDDVDKINSRFQIKSS